MNSEPARIYRAIFGQPIPAPVESHWRSVPASVFAWGSEPEHAQYDRIIGNVRDIEALEFASRVRHRNRLLTAKFQLMVHIAECHAESRTHLINFHDRSLVACGWMLLGGGVRCAYKLAKGLWLLRRYSGS